MEIQAGTEIGGYRILNLLGQGGMGVVYLADNVATGQRVALKLLTPDLARSSGFRERFVREANYASSMRHPNVIEVFNAGEQEGVLFIAMQYVEGEDLKALLVREGRLDAQRTVWLLGQVASALDAAHSTGLLHRDIKPGNVMIAHGQPEHCYLTDFGLSKNPSSDSIALTAQGEFVGTIDYTAPELVLGKKADSRLDVYSLGCLFYECLAGQPPFPKERDVEVLYAHIQDPAPHISAMRPDLPPALDDVIIKAMAKKPDDRFPTCSAFIDAARLIVGEPVAPPPPPPPPPPGVPVPPAAAGAPPSPSPPPPPPGPPPLAEPPPPPAAAREPTPPAVPAAASANAPTDAPPPVGASDPTPGPTPSVPLDAVLLRVTEGPASGKVLRVAGEELLIGRQAPGDGKLGNDIEISRRHARVTRSDEGTFVIEDLGSTNGTYVNGTRIAGAYVLSPGDKLEMGDTKLTVEAPPPIEDKVIAPTGAPPAVTTFAAIPSEFSAEVSADPAVAEPEPEPTPSEPAEEEPTAQQEAAVSAAPAPAESEPEPAPSALADAAEAAPEPEAAAPQVEAAPEPEAITEEPEAEAAAPQVEAAPEPEAITAEPEAEAAAPEAEPETAALPESEPVAPEREPEPAVPLLVASSGPISVRVERTPSGDLTLHIDDGEAPARFVRRGGAWTVDE